MSFLSSLFPTLGAVAGGALGSVIPGVGTALGASIGGGLGSALTQRDATNAQTQAGQQALDLQKQIFEQNQANYKQNQANLAPWMQGGQNAFGALSGYAGIGPGGTFNPNAPGVKPFGVEDFRADPGYEWAKNQGLDAILNKRSQMGGLFSGNTMRALEDYGQGLADQQYQNAYNRYNQNIGNVWSRLGGLSSIGENAAAGVGNIGSNAANSAAAYGNQAAGLMTDIGSAQSAGLIGAGQAAAGPGGINNWLLAQAMQNGLAPQGVSNIPAGWGGTASNPWYG